MSEEEKLSIEIGIRVYENRKDGWSLIRVFNPELCKKLKYRKHEHR